MQITFFQQQKLEQLKKEQEKEKKKAVTSSISSILKAKERSTKKQPVVKTDSDKDDRMEVSTKADLTQDLKRSHCDRSFRTKEKLDIHKLMNSVEEDVVIDDVEGE